jgi:uncharacterized coiled-coil protein SlyX
MTRSRWWRRGGVIHPGERGIIVMPTSTGTVDVANLAPSGPPAAGAEVERLTVVVERAVAARIDDLERQLAIQTSRAETFRGQLSETKDTLYATERCMDVMREASCRIVPMVRNGNLDGVTETARWIMAQRPDGWRPE